ncbi:L-galactose dehydrogenase [Biomphalaria glabrata]|nr:L-galactose dehydrogenase-like [Biomphalaria glabrata]
MDVLNACKLSHDSNSPGQLPATYVDNFHSKKEISRMPYRCLGNTGLVVSALSFGASSLGSVFRSTIEDESVEIVKKAIRSGINYVDTAPWYGQRKSETILGKALKDIPRSSYYIATKVGRYEKDVTKMFDFSTDKTFWSVNQSLNLLGLEYIDVIQIHDIEFAPSLDIILQETLPALQKLKEEGKVKYIGITGYPLEPIKSVIEQSSIKIDVVLSYCRATMNDNILKEWLPYFQSRQVGVVNASPIGMGLLSSRGPPEWHPAPEKIKQTCTLAAAYCQERGVDISRLGLRFSLDQVDIPTTLVSTASLENLSKNLESVYTPLSDLETKVTQEVMERFFQPLNNAHWEGIELSKYQAQLSQN